MKYATISLIDQTHVDTLSAEILAAIVKLNKRGTPPLLKYLTEATSAACISAVAQRMARLEEYGYIRRSRRGRGRLTPQIIVLRSKPKVRKVDQQKISADGRRERERIRMAKKRVEIKKSNTGLNSRIEQVVRDAKERETAGGLDVTLDRGSLFTGGWVRACKVG